MTLMKYEKEIIILFNEGEDTAHIQTYNAGLRKRLAAFSKKHPDLCRLEKSFAQGGVIYVAAICVLIYFIVDILYAVINPNIRLTKGE